MDYPLSRAVAAEAYGTFVLVFIGTTSITVMSDSTHFAIGPTLGLGFVGFAFGGALLIAMATVGAVSGGHFNPAVTLAMFMARRLPGGRVVPYIAAQVGGAIIASVLQFVMVGQSAAEAADLGSTLPNQALPLPIFAALLAEIIGTLVLVMTFLGSTDPASSGTGWGTAGIGVALAAGIWALGAVSGASLNPARSLGPALVSIPFDPAPILSYWVYLVGPVLGALLAASIYAVIFKANTQGQVKKDELPA